MTLQMFYFTAMFKMKKHKALEIKSRENLCECLHMQLFFQLEPKARHKREKINIRPVYTLMFQIEHALANNEKV